MTRRHCNRIWQAEAMEDGRLAPPDLASFERHVLGCEACAKELRALRDLASLMASIQEPERTELTRRRARSELLRKANEELTGPKPRPGRWRIFSFAAVFCAALAGIAGVQVYRNSGDHAPVFEIQDVSQAVWSVEKSESASRVVLRSGAASFEVDRVKAGARFLVELPDGSIEVKGTRFVVDVRGGQTQSVEVFEGTVLLQVPSFEGLLHAGERWPAKVTGQVIAPPSAAPSAEVAIATAVPAASEAIPVLHPRLDVPSSSPHASASGPAPGGRAEFLPVPSASANSMPPKDQAGPRFAEAMGAFSAGDYGRADILFAAFIRDFPRDGRAEDAMFLRAQGRIRRGDRAGAAAIAREYLRAFPRALRRPEAERMAGEK